MLTFAYLAGAVGLGMLLSLQPAINTAMARQLGSPLLASLCSILISFGLLALVWMTLGGFSGNWSKIATLPWWVLVGGAAGACFVAGGVLIAPRIGLAMFFVCVVAGQLAGAALADAFGAFGGVERTISPYRVIGIVLVAVGAAVAQAGG